MRQSRYHGHVAKADDLEPKTLRQAGLPLHGGRGRLHLPCWRAAHPLIHNPRTWIGVAPLSDQRLPELRYQTSLYHRQGATDHTLGALAHSRSRSAPARRASRKDAPTARNGRASLRYNQGPNGSNTLLDEDAAAGCLRDGTTRFGLQPHPRNEPHGRPAAHGSDQSIVRPEKAAGTHSRRPPKSTFLLIPERFYTAKTQSRHQQIEIPRCTALTCYI